MDRLNAFAIALALVLAAPVTAEPADRIARWEPEIAQAAKRSGVPADWIVGVMRAESGGRTKLGGRPIVSRKGAMGLMQLMPATWNEARRTLSLGADPHDPADNILAGAWYLRHMYERFGYPGLFAAYNAGPGRYAAYLAGRASLPHETRTYLARVAGRSTPAPRLPEGEPDSGGLFFSLRGRVASPLFIVRDAAAVGERVAVERDDRAPER